MEFSEHTKWIEKEIKDRAAFLIILNSWKLQLLYV